MHLLSLGSKSTAALSQSREQFKPRFQGHRTLHFQVQSPLGADVQAPQKSDPFLNLKQFATTLIRELPSIHLLQNQAGQEAIIVTVNPIQKTLDIFYTDFIKHFIPQAVLQANLEMEATQSENPTFRLPTIRLNDTKVGSHDQIDMPKDVPFRWENWLAAQGLQAKATEPESSITLNEPYALKLAIGQPQPTFAPLSPNNPQAN